MFASAFKIFFDAYIFSIKAVVAIVAMSVFICKSGM